jgi:aryl-alcohol dehydrogenase-like predicted oxidoreductase
MAEPGPIPGAPDDPIVLALGFALAYEAVDTTIVGTRNPEHMQSNIRSVEQELPIADEAVEALQERFDQVSTNWPQEG